MLKRKIIDQMTRWKQNSNGKTALMIDGARRVGKSTICEYFAKKAYRSYLMIDFGNISDVIIDLFNHESDNIDLFLTKLSVYYGKRLYERESVIIFDEVQQFPRARQLIKYLVADGRYDYIETGSLIRIRKNVQNIIIPSEEEHLEMFPMDFEEFLWAIGNETAGNFIKQCFENRIPLGQALHRQIMNHFREYLLVGGMPQVVAEYVNRKDFERADTIKRQILHLYREDVVKFAAGYEDKVFAIFDQIPEQLSKKEKRYKLSSLNQNARFRNYEDAFIWLNEAMVINTCYNCTDPNIGLALSSDHTTQKCYMADTGLLITQTFSDRPFTDNILYKAVLFDKININEGMIMENAVAQALRRNGHRLYFYSRVDAAHRENHMEIDFMISEDKQISPIEVKSGNYRAHSSLDKFRKKFEKKLGNAYILYPKDLMIKEGVIHLPLYMAMCL